MNKTLAVIEAAARMLGVSDESLSEPVPLTPDLIRQALDEARFQASSPEQRAPIRAVVVMEGGVVQEILGDGRPIEIAVLEYDDGDSTGQYEVPQDGGNVATGDINVWKAKRDDFTEMVFRLAEQG